jgi:tetratricopeptide (TPR) repeat protein
MVTERNEPKKKPFIASSMALIAAILFGFTSIYFLSGFLERTRPALPENYADEDLALQGASLKNYSLGFEGLIADWYWMQSLQYLGDKIVNNPDAKTSLDNLNALNPRLLYPYLDNATTLDTRFLSVYEFGATVLPAINKEQAIKLLEKGIADNPNEWRLYQHLGYIYWRIGNFEKASEIYTAGFKIPNAPTFMQMMATKTKTDGASRETARTIYRQIFDEAQDEQIKENARLRLLQLDSLDEREAIHEALQAFKTKTGRCADNWREILPLLQMVKLAGGRNFRIDKAYNLIDPSDVSYVLQKEKCDVGLDYSRTKIPQS